MDPAMNLMWYDTSYKTFKLCNCLLSASNMSLQWELVVFALWILHNHPPGWSKVNICSWFMEKGWVLPQTKGYMNMAMKSVSLHPPAVPHLHMQWMATNWVQPLWSVNVDGLWQIHCFRVMAPVILAYQLCITTHTTQPQCCSKADVATKMWNPLFWNTYLDME